jgi:hypothetical protein
MQQGELTACEDCGGTKWVRCLDGVACGNCGGSKSSGAAAAK